LLDLPNFATFGRPHILAASQMSVQPAPSFLHRVKRVGAFLAIVWGVAASFVVFDMLFVFGAGRLIRAGGPFESLALSSALQSSEVCGAAGGDANAASAGASTVVRARAWALGVQMGIHTRAALILADRDDGPPKERARESVAARRRWVEEIADALKVPSPGVFTPQNPTTTNIDFVPFVEGATNQTGRALATSYGRDACELYKMGAYWGFSTLVRAALPGEANIMAVEITYYARRLEIPETLWRPMVDPTPADASGDALATEADAATDRIIRYLQTTPAGDGPPAR
jgi:hypothetical protein